MNLIRLLLLCGSVATCFAQWLNYKESGTPRLRDGRANLLAPAPKGPDGKPDLSGVWQVEKTPFAEMTRLFGPDVAAFDVPGDSTDMFSKYALSVFADLPMDQAPMTKEAAEIFERRLKTEGKESPTARCLPGGIPLIQLLPFPFKILQAPRAFAVLNEGDGSFRQIYLDGRPLPQDPQSSWMGYSTGHWEGATLVVDTNGFNDKSWIDILGHPRSEGARLTERYTRRDFGHMDLEIKIEDAKYYTRPFSFKVNFNLLPDTDVLESVCNENEKDVSHFPH